MSLNFPNANLTDSLQADFPSDWPYMSPRELHHFHLFASLFEYTNLLLLNPKSSMQKTITWSWNAQTMAEGIPPTNL